MELRKLGERAKVGLEWGHTRKLPSRLPSHHILHRPYSFSFSAQIASLKGTGQVKHHALSVSRPENRAGLCQAMHRHPSAEVLVSHEPPSDKKQTATEPLPKEKGQCASCAHVRMREGGRCACGLCAVTCPRASLSQTVQGSAAI